VPSCAYPLTGVGCVSRIYTDHAVIEVGSAGARIIETWGLSASALAERLGVNLTCG
jgi:3-oxoadipate CoA-transferase beta subunit